MYLLLQGLEEELLMEFTIQDMIALFIKRFVFIAVCTLASLVVFYTSNRFIMKPSYTASIQMYVDPNESTSSGDLTALNYAQKVVTTYIKFLQTKVFYRQVIVESGLNYSIEDLKDMTTIQSVDNTEIFQISVTAYDPMHSFQLVEAMQKIAPELIKGIKDSAKISVVDPVIFPTTASSPNILLNTILGGILGFFLSILVSFLWEILDVKVKNQDDLLKKYQIPILGSIPDFEFHTRNKFSNIKKSLKFLKKESEKVENPLPMDSEFFIIEAYKTLRINLRFTLPSEACKKIIISSPVPEDGKSTTSTNLGITIAQTGARVLLIDCDLRKGRLHSFFHIKNRPGVSDVLSGMTSLKNVVQKTKYNNLFVMSLGSLAPNPTELLAGVQMEELIKSLEQEYDYIIIDTPPVNVVSDSLSLVKLVNGVVIVVRERSTSHPNIVSAIDKFRFAEATILGFVINGVAINQGNKSKSHYYYYNQSM